MLPVRTRRSAGLFIITLSMLLALVVAAPVAAKNPAGNNGTVKIDGLDWDNHPDNEPHVGCTFEVDFHGFDEGDLWADVIFEAHPPTGLGVLLTDTIFIGGDDNSGGGSAAGWDASRQYDLTAALSAYPVHPQQGYHVKLTIHADGSHGADTKHKVYWVGPCEPDVVINPHVNPPANPPANPPNDGGGSGSQPPGEGTAGGNPDPGMLLPDTAMYPASASLALLAGALLLGGSAGLAVVEVRRARSRRR